MEILVVLDDTVIKSESIKDVIGDKGFSDVVVKKKKLGDYYHEFLHSLYPNMEYCVIKSKYEFREFVEKLEFYQKKEIRFFHLFSNHIVSDKESVALSYRKIFYLDDDYICLSDGVMSGIMFKDTKSYIEYIKDINDNTSSIEAASYIKESFNVNGLINIGDVGNFIQCITGNFDARYFNSLKGDEFKITKTSTKKKKIKSEYMYYQLLPEDMKFWYIMPFDYKEDENTASYTMERLHMTDLAIKWVHGSIDEEEFKSIMERYFCYFSSRHVKSVSADEYIHESNKLYVDKINNRVEEFKKLSEYNRIAKFLQASNLKSIDDIKSRYFLLKEAVEKNIRFNKVAVIGHGDPCFANTLYNKSTKMLKLIDPKGALIEEELWTNPYYDIAKLSHSVCGRYDFFNNALYEITVDDNFEYVLEIPFENNKYINIFRDFCEKNGFDFTLVRLYEASLFLSMLPLHIDNPHKVFGFILNLDNILKELENNVR